MPYCITGFQYVITRDGDVGGRGDRTDRSEEIGHPEARGQRLGGRLLDDRAVHHRVAVGRAELDDVDAFSARAMAAWMLVSRSGKPTGRYPTKALRPASLGALDRLFDTTHSCGSPSRPVLPLRSPRRRRVPEQLVVELEVAGLRCPCPCRLGPTGRSRSVHRSRDRARCAARRRGRGRLDGRDDPLGAAEQAQCLHRLVIGGRDVLGPTDVGEP